MRIPRSFMRPNIVSVPPLAPLVDPQVQLGGGDEEMHVLDGSQDGEDGLKRPQPQPVRL